MALREEKSKILAERKQKIQEKASLLGEDKEEHKKLIKSHDENTQRLINKIDAERLRMEADLHERLRKKREAKYKAQESVMKEELLIKRKQIEEIDRQKRQHFDREQKEVMEQLQKSVQDEFSPPGHGETQPEYTDGMASAAPVTEQELAMLLLSSPLYQKINEIAVLLKNQSFNLSPSSYYIDPKDALWVNDTELHAIEVSSIPPRSFVIYKFGCCIVKSLVSCCNHDPVSLLVADKIPPNNHIKQNAFRNSFMYDAKNRILYMRLERLDNVGEFVLVLVHILSHIQVGSFDNDIDPRFVREFYRCLSICCNDIFFCRYQGPSLSIQSEGGHLSSPHQEAFVDDLLESRLIVDTSTAAGNHRCEKLTLRLQKYAQFKFGSKLKVFLDQLEKKCSKDSEHTDIKSDQQSRAGTSHEATRSLSKASYWRNLTKEVVKKSQGSDI